MSSVFGPKSKSIEHAQREKNLSQPAHKEQWEHHRDSTWNMVMESGEWPNVTAVQGSMYVDLPTNRIYNVFWLASILFNLWFIIKEIQASLTFKIRLSWIAKYIQYTIIYYIYTYLQMYRKHIQIHRYMYMYVFFQLFPIRIAEKLSPHSYK